MSTEPLPPATTAGQSDKEATVSTSKIRIAYQGPALRDGTMAVEDLAPSLIALAGAFEHANKALYGRDAKVRVLVRADFRPGSFEVSLSVVQTWAAQVFGFFYGNTGSGIANLIEIMGFAKSAAFGPTNSVLGVLRRIRGRPSKILATSEEGDVTLGIEGDQFVVKKDVHKILQDPSVVKEIYRAMSPIRSDGVESFEIRDAEIVDGASGPSTLDVIERQDLAAFSPPVLQDSSKTTADETVFSRTMLLTVVSPSFKDGNKWKFTDGEGTINADIKDEAFIAKVEARELSFAKGDVLRCEVTTRQSLSGVSIKTEHEIFRVIKHIQPSVQLPLIE